MNRRTSTIAVLGAILVLAIGAAWAQYQPNRAAKQLGTGAWTSNAEGTGVSAEALTGDTAIWTDEIPCIDTAGHHGQLAFWISLSGGTTTSISATTQHSPDSVAWAEMPDCVLGATTGNYGCDDRYDQYDVVSGSASHHLYLSKCIGKSLKLGVMGWGTSTATIKATRSQP